jgi:hypothetical protein
MSDTTPKVGEIWQDRRGKRRRVVELGNGFRWGVTIHWESVGPNSGHNEGWMELAGWLRRGWKKVDETPRQPQVTGGWTYLCPTCGKKHVAGTACDHRRTT